jgi:hypothetical protein
LLADKCTEVTVLESSDGKTQVRGLSMASWSFQTFIDLFSCGSYCSEAIQTTLFEWHFQMFQVHVRSVLEFREVFAKGCLRRKAGHTGLNDVSSRSHGVLFVSIENVESSTVIGKLNLIDLAGIRASS